MGTNEVMICKILDHVLKLAEIASLPLNSSRMSPISQHYTSLPIPPTIIKSGAITQEELQTSFIHSFHEALHYDDQFAARYGHESISCSSAAISSLIADLPIVGRARPMDSRYDISKEMRRYEQLYLNLLWHFQSTPQVF